MSSGISLHIGINRVDPRHYSGWSGPLTACEADAEDMQRIARSKGYDSQILLTEKATRSAVITGIENAANRLAPGDIFLLSYSGHGGQVPDVGGDEMDLEDETWCLYDGELIDDELAKLWAHFAKGARILVLSDSCHSGTAIKMREYDELAATGLVQRAASRVEGDKPPVFRVMPEEVALRTYRANREFYKEIADRLPKAPPITASVRLMSACMDNQLSLDGTFNGLFTGTLLRVWNDGAFAGNYGTFHSEILRRMPSTQSPNHFVIGEPNLAFDEQNPFEI
jgi:hypothetical protein